MPCPTESRTLDEFEDASPTYTNRQGSKVRNRLTESGIVVYNAVLVGGVEEGPKEDYKTELEELLGQSISIGSFVDSAWKKKKEYCSCEKDCGCDSHDPSDDICHSHQFAHQRSHRFTPCHKQLKEEPW